MARTGLMISSFLLLLKLLPTAEESIDYYNQKRCSDGKWFVLHDQTRYVKYFKWTLAYFYGNALLSIVKVVLVDYNGTIPTTPIVGNAARKTDESLGTGPTPVDKGTTRPIQNQDSKAQDKDDVFLDSESEEINSSKGKQVEAASTAGVIVNDTSSNSETKTNVD